VLRNRLGALEDQFFATVFLASGLFFVASLVASAALPGTSNRQTTKSTTRRVSYTFLNVFRHQNGGGVPVYDLYHRTAHGNITALGCLLRIRLRRGEIGGHLKLAVDCAAVPPYGYYWSAHRFWWRRGSVVAERFGHARDRGYAATQINLSRVRPQENQKRGNATALSTLRAGGCAGMGGNRAQPTCATHSLRGSEYRPLK
jgi:hypothetical protein